MAIQTSIGFWPTVQCNRNLVGTLQLYQIYLCFDKTTMMQINCAKTQKGCTNPIDYPQPQCQLERDCDTCPFLDTCHHPTESSALEALDLIQIPFLFTNEIISFVPFHVLASVFTSFIYLKLYEKLDNKRTLKFLTICREISPLTGQVVTLLIFVKSVISHEEWSIWHVQLG